MAAYPESMKQSFVIVYHLLLAYT